MNDGSLIASIDSVRRAEHLAAQSIAGGLDTLMARAAQAVADVAIARFPGGPVVVLAGPGNNGGDALLAAAILRKAGRNVTVFAAEPDARLLQVATAARDELHRARALVPLDAFDGTQTAGCGVVIDGLFGAGLTRPISGAAARAVEAIKGLPVLAVDLPSGLSGNSGQALVPAVTATVTVTFDALKPVHCLQPAASLCGEVVVAPIGLREFLLADPAVARLNAPAEWLSRLVWPGATAHKHQRGRLFVVTGGLAQTGAARLAARAGLRVGAGLSTLLCPPSALMVVAAASTAVMTSSFTTPEALVTETERADAVIIGPAAGVHEASGNNVRALIAARRRLVLDADALTILAQDGRSLPLPCNAEDVVLTPHGGEFERLFPGLLASSANRIEAARAAAGQAGATVLLKGADTFIACPSGRCVVNTHASPFLATAGSGDVLAGVIGGLMAQGLDAFTAACAGAWMHGDAGLRIGPGLIAEDLDAALREVLAHLHRLSNAPSA